MGFIRSIIAFGSAIICLYFALLQIQEASFTYSPLHDPIPINLSLLLLCFFGGGFLSGALIVWFGRFCHKKKPSQTQSQDRATERELDKILSHTS